MLTPRQAAAAPVRQPRPRREPHGWLVAALSLLALGATVALQPLIEPGETAAGDWLVRLNARWRRWRGHAGAEAVTLLAIDADTQRAIGKYGTGDWLAREPFLRQLAFFEAWYKPSLLAYDIIFQAALGEVGSDLGPEPPPALGPIADDLRELAEGRASVLSLPRLHDLNRLVLDQGNGFLAQQLAAIAESAAFPVMLGYHFRGGWADPQSVAIRPWTAAETGTPDQSGTRVPYLLDMAIPAADVDPAGHDWPAADFAPNANLPEPALLDYSHLGYLNCPRDEDHLIRRLPLVLGFTHPAPGGGVERRFVPSLALAAFIRHLGLAFPLQPGQVRVRFGRSIEIHPPAGPAHRIPIDDRGRMFLTFADHFDTYQALRFGEFVRIPPDASDTAARTAFERYRRVLDGCMVLVGLTGTGQDQGACPLSDKIPLVFIHMTALGNMLTGAYLRPLAAWERALGLAALFALATLLCVTIRSQGIGFALAALAVVWLAAAFAGVYATWRLLPLLTPLTYLGICSFSVLSYRYFVESRERRRIRGMFSTMVSGRVLSYLEENPESFSLLGHNSETTVMFSDMTGFTAMSENLPPERLIELLNAYLSPITDCIMDNDGYLDKYLGDGFMAVWGAPYADPEHALKACRAALAQRRLVQAANQGLGARHGVTIRMRTGINSGVVTAGNVGSRRKFQYTVLGDVVNLAARLEPVNKDFGTDIIVSERTRHLLGDRFVLRQLGRIVVQGRREVEPIYEIVETPDHVDAATRARLAVYEEALQAFYARRWNDCIAGLEALIRDGGDGPATQLRRMAEACRAREPDPDWHGEYVRAGKN